MSLFINSNNLRTALKAVSKAMDKKDDIPSRSYFYIQRDEEREDVINVVGGGSLFTIRCDIPATIEDVDKPFLLHPSALKYIEKLNDDDELRIDIIQQELAPTIKITSASGEATFVGYLTDEYPTSSIPSALGGVNIRAISADLKRIIEFTDEKSEISLLSNIRVLIEGGEINIAATTGVSAARIKRDIDTSIDLQFLIPKRVAQFIVETGKAFSLNEDERFITLTEEEGNCTIMFRKVIGKFPNVDGIIPHYDNVVMVYTEQFKSALERMSIINTATVDITINQDSIIISCQDAVNNNMKEVLSRQDGELADYGGMKIRLSLSQLRSIAKIIASEKIAIEFLDAGRAVLFKEWNDSSAKYITMPYKID